MIRFCDGYVDCVEYSSLTRSGILDYFLPDHKDDVLCVYDDFTRMEYIGIITYNSFQQSISIDSAIRKEYVFYNKDIWGNAKKYLEQQSGNFVADSLLPILNEEYQLIGFAYDDADANREVRMLRELQEMQDAIQFSEFYPEIKCVRIYGFNELAFYFAKYLKNMGVAVETIGALWGGWLPEETNSYPDYECLTIYAEGVETRGHIWKDKLLKSVSVEFECIDSIYESNIKNSNIKDAGGNLSWFVEKIRDVKELVIVGTGIESLNAYDWLQANDIDILCFLSENQEKCSNRLFGKRIMTEREIKNVAQAPVFIDCCAENSAWGFGEVDRYDYEGYRRNKQYFLLRDYIDVPIGCLRNVLKGKKVILLGNLNLCHNVYHILKDIENCSISYWDLTGENSTKEIKIALADERSMEYNSVYLWIEPQYYLGVERQKQMQERKKFYLHKLEEHKIDNLSEYFSNDEVLISIQVEVLNKFTLPCLTPKNILLNVSGHMSGNVFFETLLDGHPQVLQIEDASFISNLYPICVQLAEEKAEDILHCFWEIYNVIHEEETIINHKKLFDSKFAEMLAYKDSFTSQELFVIIHIAYANMWGADIQDVQNMLIYYAPIAEISGEARTKWEVWLCDEKVKGFSVYLARNAYVRAGSYFKFFENHGGFYYPNIRSFWKYMGYGYNKSFKIWDRINVKFEDLKCSPKETLAYICKKLGIIWADSLLTTTFHGVKAEYPYLSGKGTITGFDLRSVYDLYEKYFSDFDRFRINMLFSGVQRKFSYPHVSCQFFTRRQIQEMFLQEFRFENKLSYGNEYWKSRYRKDFVQKANECLQRMRREEILQYNEKDFDRFYEII